MLRVGGEPNGLYLIPPIKDRRATRNYHHAPPTLSLRVVPYHNQKFAAVKGRLACSNWAVAHG